jgi:cathepsin L
MNYTVNAGGLVEEYGYSYTSYYGVESACDLTHKLQVATIEGYHTNKMNDQLELMNAIQVGPVAITVDASNWKVYEGGVFNGCNQTNPILDHAVVLVGYGTDDVKGDYWLIRNSWSATWYVFAFLLLPQ